MSIPKNLPYTDKFMFFGVKGKDMTRVELLQLIQHLATQSSHSQQQTKRQKKYKIQARKAHKMTQEELDDLKRKAKDDSVL